MREPLKTMFLEVGVWGEAPHIALLLFVEKQKGRFLEVPLRLYSDDDAILYVSLGGTVQNDGKDGAHTISI